jgi:hypothetical protein
LSSAIKAGIDRDQASKALKSVKPFDPVGEISSENKEQKSFKFQILIF